MKLSQTSTKDGILQRCESMTLLGDAGITSNATLCKQFIGYVNSAYHEIWMAQMSADKTWKSDDFNYTDLPDAPITLVSLQSDYTLPVAVSGGNVASFLRLNGIYHTKNGFRTYLRPMESNETLLADDGVPTAYRVQGKSIFLNVQPSSDFVTDVTNLHVEFQRVPDAFAYTDLDGSQESTQQPGFMETYHDLIPLKASSLYLLPSNPQLAQLYEQRFLTRLELFKRDVGNLDDSQERNITSEYINFR